MLQTSRHLIKKKLLNFPRLGFVTFSKRLLKGCEGESFAAPLKIYATGLAGRSSAKPETSESCFLPWRERIKGKGGRKHSFL
jgi:hypothetical protein